MNRLIKRTADVQLDEEIKAFAAWLADHCVSTFDDYDGLDKSLFMDADVDYEFMYELMNDYMDSNVEIFDDFYDVASYMLENPDAEFWKSTKLAGADKVGTDEVDTDAIADEIVDYLRVTYGDRTYFTVIDLNTGAIVDCYTEDDNAQFVEMALADYPGLADGIANYFMRDLDTIVQFKKLSETAKQYGYNEND